MTYKVVVYASPGYLDAWSIRYWLYRVTVAMRKTVDWTRIYVIGSGGQHAVGDFCRHYRYHWFTLEAPNPKDVMPEVLRLHDTHSPDVLLAFTKGGDTTWEYATLGTEMGIRTILTANVAGDIT